MIRILTLTALAVVLVGPTAFAQQATAGSAAVSDALFAQAAAAGGLAEVTISEIGLKRATDPELKKFSQQMVDEHSKMNQDLTTLASQKRIALPRALDVRSQFCAQALQGESRESFDRCYAKAQLTAHMEAVATFEAESERGQDANMKALAAKALPNIREHLRMIKPIAERYEKEQPAGARKPER
jgi:putative membrane protein